MEAQGSLPHSQQSATFPYPKPDLSSACPHIPHSPLRSTAMQTSQFEPTNTLNCTRHHTTTLQLLHVSAR